MKEGQTLIFLVIYFVIDNLKVLNFASSRLYYSYLRLKLRAITGSHNSAHYNFKISEQTHQKKAKYSFNRQISFCTHFAHGYTV